MIQKYTSMGSGPHLSDKCAPERISGPCHIFALMQKPTLPPLEAAPTPPNPFRNIGATVAGLVVFVIIIGVVEFITSQLFANPNLNYNDPAVMTNLVSNMPMQAKLLVVLGYLLGTLGGAYVAARFAASRGAWNPYVIGAFYAISCYLNFSSIPHPVWMIVASLLAGSVGIWLGARLGFAHNSKGV